MPLDRDTLAYLNSLNITGRTTLEQVLDLISRQNMELRHKAIDILAMADDIDGDVSPSTYRARSKIGPNGKIDLIIQSRGKFPHFRNDIIDAVGNARRIIEAIYCAPGYLANV